MKKTQSQPGRKRKRAYPKYLYKPKKSRFFHYCFSIDGEPVRGTTGLTDEDEASAFVEQRRRVAIAEATLRTVRQDEDGQVVDMSLMLAIDRYQAEKASKLKRPDNLRRYCDIILEGIDKETPLSKINMALVSSFVANLRKREIKRKNGYQKIAESHAGAVLRTLSSIMNTAQDDWQVKLPNCPNFSRFKFKRTYRKRHFSADEMVRIETEMTDANARVFYLLILTGLRLCNGVEMLWCNVDWEARKIKVKAKGDVEQEVDITPLVGAILQAQLRDHPPSKPSDAVFKTIAPGTQKDAQGNVKFERGRAYPMRGNTFYWAFKAACRRAEVDDARPHDLRRTCGTMTLRTTGDITIVQERLGHRDVRVTKESYAFVSRPAVTEGAVLTERATTRQLDEARQRRTSAGFPTVKRIDFEPSSDRDPSKGLTPCAGKPDPEWLIPARGICMTSAWVTPTSHLSELNSYHITIKTGTASRREADATHGKIPGPERKRAQANAILRTFSEPPMKRIAPRPASTLRELHLKRQLSAARMDKQQLPPPAAGMKKALRLDLGHALTPATLISRPTRILVTTW